MATENNIENNEVKNGHIFLCYLLIVLVLSFLAALIVIKACTIAFVEKDKWEKLADTFDDARRKNTICGRGSTSYANRNEIVQRGSSENARKIFFSSHVISDYLGKAFREMKREPLHFEIDNLCVLPGDIRKLNEDR